VHALWSAFEAGDALATLDHVHEDCEWVPSPAAPESESLRGTVTIRAYLEELIGDGVRLEPKLHSCEAVGDDVVVCGRLRVVSPAALADSPLFWVYRVRDEQVVRVESYASRRDALAAA
jgi:ketosteroid isomerase-like protein